MSPSLVDALNRDCVCASLAWSRLAPETHRYFAEVPVYVARADIERMRAVVAAIEQLVASPIYRARAWSRHSVAASFEPQARGVCMGYDFHLTDNGPKLIEVNTNAGGAMLAALQARAMSAPCEHAQGRVRFPTNVEDLQQHLVAMFENEWRLARGALQLQHIAIVDDEPEQQYLYREFELFAELFRSRGYRCTILDPSRLEYRKGVLSAAGEPIDLVYNRLVDFDLSAKGHDSLLAAHQAGSVVLTPHPAAYALYADKRNLIDFGSPELWELARLDTPARQALEGSIPETRQVTSDSAAQYWQTRKEWFFKPTRGYGSKAAYRGDKLTRSTYAELLTRDYVAQRLVPPTTRWVAHEGSRCPLKFDVRVYVYAGDVQLFAARLYQGQTTNFRTPGGGFAPVFESIADEP